jgi:hypothetical protein
MDVHLHTKINDVVEAFRVTLHQQAEDWSKIRTPSEFFDFEQGLQVVFNSRTRSASDNLILASTAARGVPCRHGHTACIPARGVGTDPTRSPSLYSGAGSVSGDLGIHGPRLTGAGPHVTGTAAPNLTACLTPPCARPATARTATSPAESSTSRRTTRAPWPYSTPDTCGSSRCGCGDKARAVRTLPSVFIGRCSSAVASSRHRDSPKQAGGDRVSMASVTVRGMRRGAARARARRGPQRDLRASGAGDGGALYGVVSLVQAHDAAEDGRGVEGPGACGDPPPVGTGDDSGRSWACRGGPSLRARASGGAPRGDKWASGWQAGVVLGGGDELGDRVCGADVTRWRRRPRAVGRDVCRSLGHRALECLQLVSSTVAAALWGALVTGL